ncbi:MAG TPA: NAD-dependent malic enzyme [Deltaproteobacteria bacterium]|nr:NAD-dependent malic enzyme [Deltaproteobacteria bacterium]
MPVPSPSYSFTVRIKAKNTPGMVGRITSVIGDGGGDIGAIDIVEADGRFVTRDYTINAGNTSHEQEIVEALRGLPDIEVINVSDRTFLIHLGGKISIENKVPLKTRDDLSMAYTPGVARVCREIARDRDKAYNLTIKKNTVAIVTDGTAVLGLGDIGAEAALPVMEGKAMLFKEFGGVNAFPICLATREPREIIETVVNISPVFGGVNLEDISSPRCFEIERELSERLAIPVFHDDQHGTAVVVLAGLLNALKVTGKEIGEIKIVVNGLGAAGIAVCRLLLSAGAARIVGVDSRGVLYRGRRENMNEPKRRLAEETNPDGERGSLADAMNGADVFIGLSAPGVVTEEMLGSMAPDAVVFALANPVPEVEPSLAARYAAIVATGRSDYQNQINNVLCFPGLFKGLLQCRAAAINREMKLAAAEAIASVVGPDELGPDYIIPSVFDKRVAERVAKAVSRAAMETETARRAPKKAGEAVA